MQIANRNAIGASAARYVASLAMVLALTGVGTAAFAQTAAPAVAPAAATKTSTAPALNIKQIYDQLDSAGYRDIREIGWDDGRYEAKALNAQGERVKLYINGATGAVERTKTRH